MPSICVMLSATCGADGVAPYEFVVFVHVDCLDDFDKLMLLKNRGIVARNMSQFLHVGAELTSNVSISASSEAEANFYGGGDQPVRMVLVVLN